jgi:hypothetical protein
LSYVFRTSNLHRSNFTHIHGNQTIYNHSTIVHNNITAAAKKRTVQKQKQDRYSAHSDALRTFFAKPETSGVMKDVPFENMFAQETNCVADVNGEKGEEDLCQTSDSEASAYSELKQAISSSNYNRFM